MFLDLPPPLTPPECDLRDFEFMPLDAVRLRDSDMAAHQDAEVFRAAVLSWCVSWHQVPAASLPDDDAAICRLIGMGRDVKGWKKLRAAGALHRFVKCSDGRLYHPVVSEKANEAWEKKLSYAEFLDSQSHKGKIGAAKRWGKQRLQNGDGTGHENGIAAANKKNGLKEQVRDSKGKEEMARVRALFLEFWDHFPKQVDELNAESAYSEALSFASADVILAGAKRYSATVRREKTEPKFIITPQKWLSGRRWTDGGSGRERQSAFDSAEEIAAQRSLMEKHYGQA